MVEDRHAVSRSGHRGAPVLALEDQIMDRIALDADVLDEGNPVLVHPSHPETGVVIAAGRITDNG